MGSMNCVSQVLEILVFEVLVWFPYKFGLDVCANILFFTFKMQKKIIFFIFSCIFKNIFTFAFNKPINYPPMRTHIHLICISITVILFFIFGLIGIGIGLVFSAYWIWSMKFFVEKYFPLFSKVAVKIHRMQEIIPFPDEVSEILISYNDLLKNQKRLLFLMYTSFIIMPRLLLSYFFLKSIDKYL